MTCSVVCAFHQRSDHIDFTIEGVSAEQLCSLQKTTPDEATLQGWLFTNLSSKGNSQTTYANTWNRYHFKKRSFDTVSNPAHRGKTTRSLTPSHLLLPVLIIVNSTCLSWPATWATKTCSVHYASMEKVAGSSPWLWILRSQKGANCKLSPSVFMFFYSCYWEDFPTPW